MTTSTSATATMVDKSTVALTSVSYSATTDILTLTVAGKDGKALSIYALASISI